MRFLLAVVLLVAGCATEGQADRELRARMAHLRENGACSAECCVMPRGWICCDRDGRLSCMGEQK